LLEVEIALLPDAIALGLIAGLGLVAGLLLVLAVGLPLQAPKNSSAIAEIIVTLIFNCTDFSPS